MDQALEAWASGDLAAALRGTLPLLEAEPDSPLALLVTSYLAGKRFAFLNHSIEVCGQHFGRDIAVNELTNCFVMLIDGLLAFDAFFCHQRWIGSNAI